MFERSATTTLCGSGGRRRFCLPTAVNDEASSPLELSTREGSRIARTVAPTNTRNA